MMNTSIGMTIRGRDSSVLILLFCVMLFGCGDSKKSEQQNAAECEAIAQDQSGSFLAPMDRSKMGTIHIDNSLDSDTREAISSAAEQWNSFSSSKLGKKFFTTNVDLTPADSAPTSPTDCDYEGANESSFYIVQEAENSRWKALGLTDRNPAATLRCYRDQKLFRQVILVNSKFLRPEQSYSVILHELGHALGLDHSCNPTSGSQNFAGCKGLAGSHPYRQAIMFPELIAAGSANGRSEVKETLQQNDKDRAFCLYR